MQLAIWQEVLPFLGTLGLTVAAAILAAYNLFKWLGVKWIEGKFERQLEAYRSEQSRELERLRHRINSVFDRTIRLHSREFEVLPDLWGKLVTAHDAVAWCISPLQESHNIHALDDEALAEVLEKTGFMEFQKKAIVNESDSFERERQFHETAHLHALRKAQKHVGNFATALKRDGIFVLPDIRSDMDRMLELATEALQEHEMNAQFGSDYQEKYKHFDREAAGLFKRIETAVSNRLWDATKTAV
ncbi:UNVERIFIED_ORG: hypothetical protein BCL66_10183 [Martelella mediterranea]